MALLLTCSPLSAQIEPAPPRVQGAEQARVRPSFARLLLPAIAGSAIGTAGGFYLGSTLGIGGGDDPGLLGALFGGAIGGAFGAAAAMHLVEDELDGGALWSMSAVSVTGGLAGAWLIGTLTGGEWDEGGVLVGFAIGQGTMAAALAALTQ